MLLLLGLKDLKVSKATKAIQVPKDLKAIPEPKVTQVPKDLKAYKVFKD